MRATPVLLVVVAFLVAGCASDSPEVDADLGPLADQADRVAQLIDEERPCEAVEAARSLASLADDDRLSDGVNEAVTAFAASAQSSIECPPATTEPATEAPPTPVDAGDEATGEGQENDDEDEGNGNGNDKDEDKGKDKDDEDEGNGDEGNGDDEHPGQGKARGRDGNPGRGNDDD